MRFKSGVRASVHAAAVRAASIHPRPHCTPHRTTPTAHPWQAPHTGPLVCKMHMRRSRPAPANDGSAAARHSPHKPTRKSQCYNPQGPQCGTNSSLSVARSHTHALQLTQDQTDSGRARCVLQTRLSGNAPCKIPSRRSQQNLVVHPFRASQNFYALSFAAFGHGPQACGTARCQPTAQNCATRQPPATAC